MDKELEIIRSVNSSFPFNKPIKDWKENGKKMIGWICTYVPEEIIYAAGILPVRIATDSREINVDTAESYLYYSTCSYIKTCLQLVIDKQFEFLDGFVTCTACEGCRYIAEMWRNYVSSPLVHLISLPRKRSDRGYKFYLKELNRFKDNIERLFNVNISDEALRDAISLYNRSRELLKSLYELRKADNPPISGAETLEIINASGRMPRDEYNSILENILNKLNKARGINQESNGRLRLMVSGSVLNNSEFIKSIEDLGGVVVVDELCTGVRYWSDPVELPSDLSPIEAICKRYFLKFPCARMYHLGERYDRVIDLVKEFRVDGVIMETMRYCVPYIHDRPVLKNRLKESDIPFLDLDVEYGMPGTGQIRTRIQAFMEMLMTRRNK